ncbi:TPA: MFS transporter, partial [Enterobacter hormaechei]
MSEINKQWLGLPLNLLWGYLAIAVFMTGDGFELAFLSHYIKSLGFTPAEASFAFTLYGLAAALSAWISGVVAEIITPQKTMLIGFVLWCVFHVLFLVFGLGQANYALILLFYGIRGLAYPLFLYAFIVVIIHNVRSDKSSSALGWYWAVYSVGIGVAGSYIPSFTIPHIGEMGTLWLALAFCLAGGVIAMVSLRSVKTPTHMHNLSTREKFAELGRAATLLYTNRSILLSSMVRIINTLSLFGFAV